MTRFTEPNEDSALPSFCGRLLRDELGSATSEGVIVAPVLILLFAAVLWAGVRWQSERVNAADVHRRPWGRALTGCVDGPPDSVVDTSLGPYRASLRRYAPRFDGDLERVTAARISESASDEVHRPALYGGGTVELTERSSVACNTVPVRWSEDELEVVTMDEFCRLTPYCER